MKDVSRFSTFINPLDRDIEKSSVLFWSDVDDEYTPTPSPRSLGVFSFQYNLGSLTFDDTDII